MNIPIMTRPPALGLDLSHLSFRAVLRLDEDRQLEATFPNNRAGFRLLRSWLYRHFAGPVRAGLEATGRYGDALRLWLHEQGHTVLVLNPQRVAAYARCIGQRNKTDPSDARTIAAYVAKHTLLAWSPPPAEHAQLQQLTRVRHQLVEHRSLLRNQINSATPLTRRFLQKVLRSIEAQLRALDQSIAHLLQRRWSWPNCRPSPPTLTPGPSRPGPASLPRAVKAASMKAAPSSLAAATPTCVTLSTCPRWSPNDVTPCSAPLLNASPPRANPTAPSSAPSPTSSCASASPFSNTRPTSTQTGSPNYPDFRLDLRRTSVP
jgi:hypothetical protein